VADRVLGTPDEVGNLVRGVLFLPVPFHQSRRDCMSVRLGAILLVTSFAFALSARAEEIKSGPTDQISGPFNVKAITGEHRKGDTKEELCYVCKYGAEARADRANAKLVTRRIAPRRTLMQSLLL
jgi:hypothetical protein